MSNVVDKLFKREDEFGDLQWSYMAFHWRVFCPIIFVLIVLGVLPL